ncbi:hypothetical protein BKA66DRAFT_599106 [Pyrenochaeta sp. MPI-SDFR-AT-0127]|nr:hypothetical protein BKA66DRAFT_599106 [Pyrenochaeta sp. MPI-SDFR-AT-0127]
MRSASVTPKRKRSPQTERHSRTSNKTSKHRSGDAAHSARQRKPPLPRGRSFLNHPSALQSIPAAQYSGCDTKIQYSDHSNNDCSEGSGDFGSKKRPLSTAWTDRPRRHTQTRNRSSPDEDDEYEVEGILEARINCKRLWYRAK